MYLLFFVTGACSLMYQVLWARMFGLVFGNTLYASSAVLAAFMAGLALGSYLSGSLMRNRSDGLQVYAFLELSVGVLGVLMPFAVQAASGIDIAVFRRFAPSYAALTGLRFAYSFILMVVPCTFMGATLPVLCSFSTDAAEGSRVSIGGLYGINTLGAFTGCFAGGFLFIGSIGISKTTYLAALLNAAVFATAWFMYARSVKTPGAVKAPEKKRRQEAAPRLPASAPAVPPAPAGHAGFGRILLAAYAASGFAALALEVGWTRSLVWVMGMDSYAFAAMLSVILAGIGIGSLLYPALTPRIKKPLVFIGWLQAAVGLFVVVSIFAIHGAVGTREWLSALLNAAGLKALYRAVPPYTVIQMAVSASILFIPSLLMGLAFPAYAAAYIGIKGNPGKGIGNIYCANTLGAIAGSLAMGFFIIPRLGLLPSIAAMAAVYFCASLAVILGNSAEKPPRRLARGAAVLAAALLLVLSADMSFTSVLATTLGAEENRKDESIVYFKEHATGSVLVKQSRIMGKEMLIDGVQVASTGDFDLHSHLYPAHLMALLKKDLDDVLVIAFGAGGTSGSLLKYPEVKRLDVVEISEGVIEPAKRYFTEMNSNVFADPRLNLIIQDGKNFIKMTEKKYDVIYSGPIHPQSNQGSAALYTREYFRDCSAKLKKGGLQCLWLPLHMSSPDDFMAVLKAYLDVYPCVTLWQMPATETSESHPHLIGSEEPILPDYGLVAERLLRPEIQRDLGRLHEAAFKEPSEFFSQLAMQRRELDEMIGGRARVNTDDIPSVEFYARPFDVQLASKVTKCLLYQEIEKRMVNPFPLVQNVPPKERKGLEERMAGLFDGYKALIKGHAYYVARVSLDPDPDMLMKFNYLIVTNYSKAYKRLPESAYLKRFFEETGVRPRIE